MAVAIASAFAAYAPAATAAETLRYVLITENGKQAGEQVVERGDDGLTKVRFIYKNNGRGPELTEQIRYNADGTMASYAVQGNSTYGAVVNEQFSVQNGKAAWQSTTERGEQALNGPAMYVPLNNSFEVASAAITALSAAPDGKLALLPSGTLTQRKLAEAQVTLNGQSQRVQLLAQTGLGLSPQFYWPTTGAVQTGGRVAALLELGMGFHPDFTGRQNALMAGQLIGLSVEEVTALMPEIEAFADIGDYIDPPVR
eukprot:gene33933-38353_t